jgi:hypothetical protein
LDLFLQVPQLDILQRILILLAVVLFGNHLKIQHVFGELVGNEMLDDIWGN